MVTTVDRSHTPIYSKKQTVVARPHTPRLAARSAAGPTPRAHVTTLEKLVVSHDLQVRGVAEDVVVRMPSRSNSRSASCTRLLTVMWTSTSERSL